MNGVAMYKIMVSTDLAKRDRSYILLITNIDIYAIAKRHIEIISIARRLLIENIFIAFIQFLLN